MKIIRMKNTAIVADNIAVIELKDNTLKVPGLFNQQEVMDGKDMRSCASAMNPGAPVFFMDKDGGIHEVYSFKYVRNKEIGSANLLLEIGAIIKDFGECHVEQPPQELIDYINEHC